MVSDRQSDDPGSIPGKGNTIFSLIMITAMMRDDEHARINTVTPT